MAGKIRRTRRELRKPVPVFESKLQLDHAALHRDLLKKLNELKKPQAYLTVRLGIARSTFWRITQNKEITLTTFLKLVAWLDQDINTYVTTSNKHQTTN